jgi:RNA polymerase sigma-70 factor, ECF subfamily
MPAGRGGPTSITVAEEPDTNDADLIAAAKRGDNRAFARLFRRYADNVRTHLTRLVGPSAERDDLVQKIFLSFHRTLPTYRGEATLSTFLHRVTVNVAYDHLRVRLRQPPTAPERATANLLARCGPHPENLIEARADLTELLVLLDELSPKKRIAFVLVAVEGHSLSEAALLVDAQPETVKQRVLHARHELLALMARRERSTPKEKS